MESNTTNEEIQTVILEPEKEEPELKIRPLERIKLHPKVPIEPSTYGKGKNFSRPWILQDGREVPGVGSEMRESYKVPKKPKHGEGISSFYLVFCSRLCQCRVEHLMDKKMYIQLPSNLQANMISLIVGGLPTPG